MHTTRCGDWDVLMLRRITQWIADVDAATAATDLSSSNLMRREREPADEGVVRDPFSVFTEPLKYF
jgi:hypothetical protein